jgi:hypothetical protein
MASPIHDVVASNWVSSNQPALNFLQLNLCEVRSHPNAAVVKSPNCCVKICEEKQKFVDEGLTHSYCSRSCARRGEGPSLICCELDGCRATGKSAFANFCSKIHAEYVPHTQLLNDSQVGVC